MTTAWKVVQENKSSNVMGTSTEVAVVEGMVAVGMVVDCEFVGV